MKTIAVILLFVTVITAQFPSFIKLCKRDSQLNECIKNNINGAKGQFENGIPSLFVSKNDPLVIDPELVVTAPTYKFTHRKGFIYTGTSKFNVKNVNLDLDRNFLQIDWVWESLQADGNYKLEGNLLNFVINGEGPCLVRTDNVGISLTMNGERKQKGGKDYIVFKESDIKMDLAELKASINFVGLFPTAEENESGNKLMNENPQAAIMQFQPIILKTIVAVVTNSIQQLFETYSIDELFPK